MTAGEQSAGRGRQGRVWTAQAATAVLMSVVLRDLGPAGELLPLAAAVATCEAAEEVAPVQCRVKWPNDVWVDGRKLAGILIEGRPQEGWAVLGIGLNVRRAEFPGDLSETATALGLEAVEPVLTELVARLNGWLSREPAAILAAWRERDALLGSAVHWDGGDGTAAGIDDSGALLVEAESGTLALQAGEVHLLRP